MPFLSAFLPLPAFPKPSSPPPTRRPSTCVATPRRAVLAGLVSTGVLLSLASPSAAASPATVSRTDAEWRLLLAPDAYRVLRQSGTERPFSSALNGEARDGVFACAGCGSDLFVARAKFDSGTGWPSFFKAEEGKVRLVETRMDRMLLQRECRCAKCDGHLGHVFRDGPKPTGLRYCINGLALKFVPQKSLAATGQAPQCEGHSFA